MNDEDLKGSIVLDLYKIACEKESELELPFWFVGQSMQSNFDCPKESNSLVPMGKDFGYQHIWQESSCDITNSNIQFNWFNSNRFYTITAYADKGDKVIKGRAGANDPNYNLRPDPVLVHRKMNSKNTYFISVIEAHGLYDRATEIPENPYGTIRTVSKIYEDENYLIASFETEQYRWEIMLSLSNNNTNKNHQVHSEGKTYVWIGTTKIKKIKIKQNE